MIDLDDKTFTLKTPTENTETLLNYINSYCSEKNIRNSKGELIYISANFTNPLYLILWGLGYFITAIQNLIYSVGKSLNVQEASDEQLLNIADMAGIKRGSASVTTFTAQVRAREATDPKYQSIANDGKLVITSNDTITYLGVVYVPAVYPSLTVEPGQYGYLTFVAQSAESQNISEGLISGFDTDIPNLYSFTQFASAPAQEEETIASLRARIQRRQYSGTTLDFCIDALRGLPGITAANLIYNTSMVTDMYVGADNIYVPPRFALVVVQGYSEDIAKTYYSNLTAPTISYDEKYPAIYGTRNIPERRILQIQNYVTHSNQSLPVLVLKPYLKQLYIKLYLELGVTAAKESELKDLVASYISKNVSLGKSVTSSAIFEALKSTTVGLVGAQVSEDGVNYSYTTEQAEDVLWTISTDTISVEVPEEEEPKPTTTLS